MRSGETSCAWDHPVTDDTTLRREKPGGRFNVKTTIAVSALLTVLACAGSNAAQEAPDKAQAVPKAESCVHEAPKSECFICDPKLRDKGRLWCNEHSRYEDRCWICHPEAQDKKRLFCKEHSLYEDECFLCHPELKKTPAKPAEPTPPNSPADPPSR